MFILTENNFLVNSIHIVSIYILEKHKQFRIVFDCSAFNTLTGIDENFEVKGNIYDYRYFETREEAEAALLEFGNILNKNEA